MSDKFISCSKCGDTGIDVDGNPCDCGAMNNIPLPNLIEIPSAYQGVEFSSSLLPMEMPRAYGVELDEIISIIKSKGRYQNNLLICSPPNTGKTVFAYTIFRIQFSKAIPIPELMDIIEARELMYSNSYDSETIAKRDKVLKAPIALFKIPLDVPFRFAEFISSLIERRVRNNGTTIFLYGGNINGLKAQDKYDVLNRIIRDGSYSSLRVINYTYPNTERKEE